MTLASRQWNTEQCNRCHQCKFVPTPRSKKFSAACPAIKYGSFHAYSCSGKIISAYALEKGRLIYTKEAIDSITTCSLCGVCDTACRSNHGDLVAPIDTLYELRARLYVDGQIPEGHKRLLSNIESFGNPYAKPAEQRHQWALGLNLKNASQESVKVLLHIGCSNAFEPQRWPGLVWIAQQLRQADIDFGTLGVAEPHAGGLAFDLGHQALAHKLAEHTQRLIRSSGAHTLVTMDAQALAAFRNIYPRLGVTLDTVRIMHITEFFKEFGLPQTAKHYTGAEQLVTYHDPCRLGRLSEPYTAWEGTWKLVMNGMRVSEPPQPHRFGLGGVYDQPRKLIRSVPGTRLVEMERVREFSYCCGAGAGGYEAHPEFAIQAAQDRLEEACSSGAKTLITSCAGCAEHLGKVAEQSRFAIRVVHLLDYLKDSATEGGSLQ